MLRIYRNSILCLQSSGNIHPSVPKQLHLHALSDKIMKQKSPVGSCGKRFSSFPSRNFNSWVQTLPIYKKKCWSTCTVQVFLFSQTRIKLRRISLFHCNNASLLLRCWWFLSTAHVARSVISKAQALLLWVLPPHGGCVLNGWQTVILWSGFQQFKLTKTGELRNPARSESDWSYKNCPPPKKRVWTQRRTCIERKASLWREDLFSRGDLLSKGTLWL